MNEPLASAAGNAVEVRERRRFPHRPRPRPAAGGGDAGAGRRDAAVGRARVVQPGRHAPRAESACRAAVRRSVFARMVAALGGPPISSRSRQAYLPRAATSSSRSRRPRDGFVTGIATRDIGLAVVALGGGRTRPDDKIDHAVGITRLLPVGAEVQAASRWRWSMRAPRRMQRRPPPRCFRPIRSATRSRRREKAVIRRILPRVIGRRSATAPAAACRSRPDICQAA